MAFKDLQAFIHTLEKQNQLVRITKEVDSYLEITEIADRVSKAYGPALLFENIKNSPYPLLINSMGTYERMSLGLGVTNFDQLQEQLETFLDLSNYMGIMNITRSLPRLTRLASVFPIKLPTKGHCQEVIEHDPDLNTLPVLHCWPEDGGRFFTLPLVITKDPKTNIQNMGMYRLQVFDRTTTGMHWHLHKDGREIYESYRSLGGKMPVAVALGCDPAITYAATAPLPKMIDEMMFAGFLRKRPVQMVKCITNDLYVPSDAEFILEGYVDVNEALHLEGPFGDHTGYYSLADYYPAFHVTCITHKKKPVYPATIVGKPPMEDCYIGKATERLFLPLLHMVSPEILDMDFPLEGVFHGCVIIAIKKRYPGHGKKVMNTAWGMGQMMYTKMVIVVDETINPHDYEAVSQAILLQMVPERDLILSPGPLDALDHASPLPHYGHRVGLDATKKWDTEGTPLIWHETIANHVDLSFMDSFLSKEVETINLMTEGVFKGYIIATIQKMEQSTVSKLTEAFFNSSSSAYILLLLDASISPQDASTVSWKLFNNIDGKRDLFISTDDNGISRVVIDATKKTAADGHIRLWPNDIEMSEKVKEHVSKCWEEYGIGDLDSKNK